MKTNLFRPSRQSMRHLLAVLLICVLSLAAPAWSQDLRPGDPGYKAPPRPFRTAEIGHEGASPFEPPKASDSVFLVDTGPGLDSGCTFRNSGPLQFTIKVNRVAGDIEKLKQAGLISLTAILQMPAFDVDYDANAGEGINPERDEVYFNGKLVRSKYLTGLNDAWVINSFEIPIEDINFATDPGPGGVLLPGDNIVTIHIDTANTDGEYWCTSIDWAALSFTVARPVVMIHGLLSDSTTWNRSEPGEVSWVNNLSALGLPNDNSLNMDSLDTIPTNAEKIAAYVQSARQRWGVEKVNLVCHSKGGLDARHYVELLGGEFVDELIQIGTPNAGTPLADYVQGLAIGGTSDVSDELVNALAGPKGVQLTLASMSAYNSLHGANPKVRYTALAGDYQPRQFFDPIEELLNGIVGPGDTIVPTNSVHALSYTRNLTISSTGADKQATHTNLTGSANVYNAVSGALQAFGLQPAGPAVAPLPLGRSTPAIGSITQGGSNTHTLVVDQDGRAFFSLTYPSGDLDLALISPSGERFDATTVAGSANVSRAERDILGGRMEVYNFASLEVGTWTAIVTAPSVVTPSGTAPYAISAWISGPRVTFVGSVENAHVLSGTALKLIGALSRDGSGLAGASVRAKIVLPDDSTRLVNLADDGLQGDAVAGDGIYTGQLNDTTLPGTYRIGYTASRSASPPVPAFTREDVVVATVSRPSARLSGSYRDFGRDTDNDGLFNQLVIEAGLNVSNDGTYTVFGTLADSAGHTHTASAQALLTAGAATVQLKFDGVSLFNNGIDGPYTLRSIRVAEINGLSLLPLEDVANAWTTFAYDHTAFQGSALGLAGANTAEGEDTNGNSLFDRLNVTIGVNSTVSGLFNWSARLLDGSGNVIGQAASSGTLLIGRNTISFVFDGHTIGANNADGPYAVTDLLLYDSSVSLIVPRVFSTRAFRACEFEGCTETNRPPVAVAGPDQTLECAGSNTVAVLDGSQSSDPDRDSLTFVWREGNTILGSNAVVHVGLPAGDHLLVLQVTDSHGASDEESVSVLILDRTAPELHCPNNMSVPLASPLGAVVTFAPQVVEACSTATVNCYPASGSTFPIGTTQVTCVALDEAQNASFCTFQVTVTGAMSAKRGCLEDFIAFAATVTEPACQKDLNDAISHWTSSLNPDLWIDETHLKPKLGNKVFDEERKAVSDLLALADSDDDDQSWRDEADRGHWHSSDKGSKGRDDEHHCHLDATALRERIQCLIRADRLLAVIAVDAAEAAGAKPAKIAEDRREIDRGDKDVLRGKFAEAIDHYRNAWKHAVRAQISGGVDLSHGNLHLEFLVGTDDAYQIQASTNLRDWETIATVRPDSEGRVSFDDTQAKDLPRRFYRVVGPE